MRFCVVVFRVTKVALFCLISTEQMFFLLEIMKHDRLGDRVTKFYRLSFDVIL